MLQVVLQRHLSVEEQDQAPTDVVKGSSSEFSSWMLLNEMLAVNFVLQNSAYIRYIVIHISYILCILMSCPHNPIAYALYNDHMLYKYPVSKSPLFWTP